jgi:hypothetical protein
MFILPTRLARSGNQRARFASEQMDAARDPRIVDAINAILDDGASGRTRSVVVARGYERLRPIIEGDESPAERYRRQRAQALREMAALGNRRGVAGKVANSWSKDPRTRRRLGQWFRKLLRDQKLNAESAFGGKSQT